MLFRVRGLPIRQKTRAITALRGHPGGFGQIVPQGAFGQIVPQGAAGASKPTASVEDPDSGLPADAIPSLEGPIGTLMQVESEIGTLETGIARRAREDDVARRLMTVPGIGPPIATAQVTLAPPPEMFRRGRDFAAWPGLAPRPHSTGGQRSQHAPGAIADDGTCRRTTKDDRIVRPAPSRPIRCCHQRLTQTASRHMSGAQVESAAAEPSVDAPNPERS
jgi:transposase